MPIETEAERNRYDAGLLRFRADLLDYDAALIETIGKTSEAEHKRKDAANRREMADLLDAFQDAVDAHGSGAPEVRAAYAELDKVRAARRKDHIAVYIGNNDGLTEPTPEELGV